MNATTLKKLYEVQLEEDLKPPVRAHVDRRATRCMLYISRRMPAGELKETNAGRIWIWSDLHLGHTETISSFARPFASSQEMDDAVHPQDSWPGGRTNRGRRKPEYREEGATGARESRPDRGKAPEIRPKHGPGTHRR